MPGPALRPASAACSASSTWAPAGGAAGPPRAVVSGGAVVLPSGCRGQGGPRGAKGGQLGLEGGESSLLETSRPLLPPGFVQPA